MAIHICFVLPGLKIPSVYPRKHGCDDTSLPYTFAFVLTHWPEGYFIEKQ